MKKFLIRLPLLLLAALFVIALFSCRTRDFSPAGAGRVPLKPETAADSLSSLADSTADSTLDSAPDAEPETVEIPEPAPTAEELREAVIDRILAEMTTEEKLGQMFLASYSGENTAEILAQYHFGGFLLFAADFESETPETIAADLAALQESAAYGLILAVDEEGGTVTRISRYPQYREMPFPSPREIYHTGGMEGIRADAIEKARLLSSLGLNLNMAPVCDISTEDGDFMYARSLGESAEVTAAFVSLVVEESQQLGIGSVLKHFPGYGKAVDTHTGIAYDYRTYHEFAACDLIPFQAGIDSGAEMVMLSHIIVSAIDPERPVSVSDKAVTLLRNELGFKGVIITDDLAMAGITNFSETGYAALDAVMAGCDMLCCSNWKEQYPAVLAACRDGTIPESRLDDSVRRILRMKISMGIIED